MCGPPPEMWPTYIHQMIECYKFESNFWKLRLIYALKLWIFSSINSEPTENWNNFALNFAGNSLFAGRIWKMEKLLFVCGLVKVTNAAKIMRMLDGRSHANIHSHKLPWNHVECGFLSLPTHMSYDAAGECYCLHSFKWLDKQPLCPLPLVAAGKRNKRE